MARSEDFVGGAEEVRKPQFKSVQQMSNANFRALSVLDTSSVIPNQNGMGSVDLERRKMGRGEDPATGRSQGTFDQQMWLHHQVKRREEQN